MYHEGSPPAYLAGILQSTLRYLLISGFILAACRAVTNDQLCVQVHQGRCVDHDECAIGDMLDVCDSSHEVCCDSQDPPANPSGTRTGTYPTAQIPLYLGTCPSSVNSRIGSLWLYADQASGALLAYPDLPDEYYDCTRYQMVALTQRPHLMQLDLQVGELAAYSVVVRRTAPYIYLTDASYQFRYTDDLGREDQIYPLYITAPPSLEYRYWQDATTCDEDTLEQVQARTRSLLVVISVQVTTPYNEYILTLTGGTTPVYCNSTLLADRVTNREQCDALNYHLTTHAYDPKCAALPVADDGAEGCRYTCTTTQTDAHGTHDVRGMCIEDAQCISMGGISLHSSDANACGSCHSRPRVCCVYPSTPYGVFAPQTSHPPPPPPSLLLPRGPPHTSSGDVATVWPSPTTPPLTEAIGSDTRGTTTPRLGFGWAYLLSFLSLCVLTMVVRIAWRKRCRRYALQTAPSSNSDAAMPHDQQGAYPAYPLRGMQQFDNSFVDIDLFPDSDSS